MKTGKTEALLIGPKTCIQNLLEYILQLKGCTVTSSSAVKI